MTNENLGVATEPLPERLWVALRLWSWGWLYTGGLNNCAVGLDILKVEQALF